MVHNEDAGTPLVHKALGTEPDRARTSDLAGADPPDRRTLDDVSTHLRDQGVGELDEVKYLIYEATGQLTVVRHDAGGTTPDPGGARPVGRFPTVTLLLSTLFLETGSG